MKKFALVLLLALLGFGASAQITMKSKSEAIQTVTSFRLGYCSLKYHESLYYLSLVSSNDFEGNIIVYLGDSPESSKKTLLDLLNLHSSLGKGEFAEFSTIDSDRVYTVKKLDNSNFQFIGDYIAGFVFVSTKELKKCADAIKVE